MPDEPSFDREQPLIPEDLFFEALALSESERIILLDHRCGLDSELRVQITEMLSIADAQLDLLEPPTDQPAPERLGKYEILGELGRGGMGVVYRAEDEQLGRIVAIKILPKRFAQDADSLARFRREARLLATMNDERIATLHSLEHDEGIHYLTMEFVEGSTLAAILSAGRLSEEDAIGYCHQIAQALESAHAAGIVHRDLKPANIMVTPKGRIKILDFGIAKSTDSAIPVEGIPAGASRLSSTMQGTPDYMSPEQSRAEVIDQRSDVWALGCVFLECFGGRKLSSSVFEGAAWNQGCIDDDLGGALAVTRPVIQSLVRGCLQVDPNDRQTSSAEAALVFEELLATTPHQRVLSPRLLSAFGILVALVVVFLWIQFSKGPVALVEQDGDLAIRAVDEDGDVVWTRSSASIVGQDGKVGPILTINGDDDRPTEVVAVFQTPGIETDLFLLDAQNGATLWENALLWQRPVNMSGSAYCRWIDVLDFRHNSPPLIAVGIRDGIWYSSAIQFITMQNQVVGTYYHPGIVSILDTTGLPGYDPSLITIHGNNSSARFVRELVPFESRAHCGFVGLLHSDRLGGQAFPYSEGMPEERDWPGMKHAQELSYLVIPPVAVDTDATVHDLRTRVLRDGRSGFTAWTRDDRAYELDANLVPITVFVSMNGIADNLERQGNAQYLPVLYIEDGVPRYIDVPRTY